MTMYQDLSRLKRKIVSLYIIAGIVILTFYMLQTVFVTNRIWMEVLTQHVPAQFLLIALATFINHMYTKKKLYGSLKVIESPEFEKAELKEKVYRDIIEFPQKLFWMSFILYPMIISIKYVYEIIFILQFSWRNLLFVALKYVSSSSLIYLYSQTLTIYLRRFLKPLLLSFNKKTLDSPATLTFKKSISMSGIFLFLIYFINIFVFEYFGGQSTNALGNLLLLTVITFAVFVAFLRNLIYEHVNNLSLVSKELLNIQDHDRRELHKHIPITSLDEIGVLTSSYNKIQSKIEKIYKDIDEDLDFAKKVHNHLIPELNYKDDSLAIQAISKPVRDIGGDFYDFVQVEQNKYIVLIGDVLGKGLPASLLMSMIIGHFRASAKVDSTATELMQNLNQLLHPISQDGLFVTCGIGILDFNKKYFSYVSAGHLPPMIIGSDVTFLESSSFPLGVSRKIKVNEIRFPFNDDTKQVVLYTDGIIEQTNSQEEQYGFSRLKSLFSESTLSPDAIIDDVFKFSSQTEILDDISVLVITLKKRGNT